jgi:serine phosphatase RsbU (regulator of sigma subunit)
LSGPRFLLRVTPADGTPFDHSLAEDSLVIGRSLDADLSLSDPFLSRRHTRLFRNGEGLWVEDLGSRNGTLLNDRPILEPTLLRPGDVVRMSGSALTVGLAAPPVPPQPPALPVSPGAAALADGTILLSAAGLLARQGLPEIPLGPEADGLRQLAARAAQRLQLLNEIHRALGQPLAMADLLELILARVSDHLRPDRGTILLRDGQGDFTVAAQIPAGGGDLGFSRSLAREVTDKAMAALVLDVRADARFAQAASMLLSGIRSLIAAPLLTPEGCSGLIVLESRGAAHTFGEEELELLVSLASVAALHLRNALLAAEAAERRRLEEELALARRIQVALLPSGLPEVPGWELFSANVPSRGVSGDYYEVVEREGGRELVFIVADVSGKGMAASLLTAALQAFAAGPIEDGLPPHEMAARLSRLLYRRTPPEKFATALLAVLEPGSGRLRYANAGHNPPLLLRADDRIETLPPTGVPLGLLPAAQYAAGEVELGAGDLLVLYTDGIVEACAPDDAEYGEARLIEICRRQRAAGCAALAAALDRDLEDFAAGIPFADDRTLVLLRRLPE